MSEVVREGSSEEAIRLFCGLGERQWNLHPVAPGPFACVSPIYSRTPTGKQWNRVVVPTHARVLQDSGAFCEPPAHRLSLLDALKRQEAHAHRFGYADQMEARASYDVLIEEKWSVTPSGRSVPRKRRWSETQAEQAVEATVQAAHFLNLHRGGVPCVFSVQGITPRQYVDCAACIVPLLHAEDWLGLGGWACVGKSPAQLLPVFRETMALLIPFLGRQGVRRVHLWGVCYAPALSTLLWLCDQWGIALSTDSSGPRLRPAFGQWGYAEWRDSHYERIEQDSEGQGFVKGYNGQPVLIQQARGIHRAEHVRQTRLWLAHFRATRHYPHAEPPWLWQPRQLTMIFSPSL